jgi:hypothetical protein
MDKKLPYGRCKMHTTHQSTLDFLQTFLSPIISESAAPYSETVSQTGCGILLQCQERNTSSPEEIVPVALVPHSSIVFSIFQHFCLG